MKQRLRSLKKTRLILIAAALVAAILVAVFFALGYIQQVNNDAKIAEFSENVSKDIRSFEGQYKEMSENEKKAKRNDLFEWLTSLFFGDSRKDLRSLDEIKEILKEYPDDYTEVATRSDIYTIGFGEPLGGRDRFDAFIANCRLGIPDYIIIDEVNVSLDSIYYFVEYDGNSYHIVEDKTRDGYEGDSGYSESFGKYLKIEDYLADDGTIIEYGFLTDNISLLYKDVIKFYEDINTVSNPEDYKEPDYWPFYICTIKQEYLESKKAELNGYTEESLKQYTGFTDVHPFFSDDNPAADYDGDGIFDRIYRKYEPVSEDSGNVSAYLFFGDGNTVTLNKNIWGRSIHTEVLDVTGDGNRDICFFEYTEDINGTKYKLRVFENRNGNYILTRFPSNEFVSIELMNDNSGNIAIKCVEDSGNESVLRYEGGAWKDTQ